jgi:hypothetical protein
MKDEKKNRWVPDNLFPLPVQPGVLPLYLSETMQKLKI